jgi:acetyltransferase-like isoleucine patch superfamily enzyme
MVPGGDSLRVSLHRRRGVRIGKGVFIGEDVYIESEYPEVVEIQDGAQISLRSTIVAHTRGPGRIVIGKDAYIGVGCVIAAPANRTLTIGEGAVVTAGSVVSSSIPPYTLFGGERGRALAQVTKALPLCTEYMEFVRGLRPIRPGAKDKHND